MSRLLLSFMAGIAVGLAIVAVRDVAELIADATH